MAWWRPTWPDARTLLTLGLLALPAAADEAASPIADLAESGAGHVRSVPDGLTLVLEDGRTLKLAGLDVPHATTLAQERLTALALDRDVSQRGPVLTDRYARQVSQIARDDGIWLEADLLDTGAARVATTPEQPALVRDMLAHEAVARRARRGLWADLAYAVRAPYDLDYTTGLFELIEGRVRRVEKQRSGLRLTFQDGNFELRLDRAALARLGDGDPRPDSLAGKRIRVRGWLRWAGNPLIDLADPALIEVLDQAG